MKFAGFILLAAALSGCAARKHKPELLPGAGCEETWNAWVTAANSRKPGEISVREAQLWPYVSDRCRKQLADIDAFYKGLP